MEKEKLTCNRYQDGQDMLWSCESCELNRGISNWQGNLPCGQQNCWFSCTVCRHNGMEQKCSKPLSHDG